MPRYSILVAVVLAFCTAAAGQPSLPPELARLPEAIRTLPWKSIDLNTVGTLEYSRALLILNEVLNKLAPVRASEADLMSIYIDQQNFGAELAKTAPPSSLPLSYTDGVKIATALLRGPLAGSSYATQLADSPESTLAAYRRMYDQTCQRRWLEVAEATLQVRYMGAFLEKSGKVQAYQAWAKTESENRQAKYEAEMAQRRVDTQAAQADAAAQRRAEAQQAQLERENQQMQDALAAAQFQQQQAEQMLQQQQAEQQPQAQVVPPSSDYYGYGGYAAWGTPAYYGTNAGWARDAAHAGAARAATEQRISGWHGAGGGGVRRR